MKIVNCKLKILLLLLFLLPLTSHASALLNRPPSHLGLVGYWTMDGGDISGTALTDRSGNGNTGTISGATTAIGKMGAGLNFDGAITQVTTGSDILNVGTVTMCAWVYSRSSSGAVMGNVATRLHIDSNKWAVTSDSSSHDALSSVSVVLNSWQHICGKRLSNGLATLYVNGIISGAEDQNSGTPFTFPINFRIGNRGDGSSDFNGLIDEVRIYNRALSATEVQKLYGAGSVKINAIKPVDADLPVNAQIGYVHPTCAGHTLGVDCWTTLNDWETAFGGINFTGCTTGDLTCPTVNKSAIAVIDGNWTSPDTQSVTISGWTTGPNNYIKIYTTAQARHSGKWDDTKYRLEADSVLAMDVYEDYVKIDGLQFKVSGTTAGARGINLNFQSPTDNAIYFSNNIFKGGGGSGTNTISGITQYDSDTISYIWNNIFYDFINGTTLSYGMYLHYGTTYAYNNTLIDNYFGLRANGAATIKNNIVKGSGNSQSFYGTYTAASTNNSTDSTQTPSGSTGTNYTSKTFSFVSETSGSEDYHLLSTDTGAKDLGVDTSAESAPLNFTTDIDRQTRLGQWDIGADERIVNEINISPTTKLTDGLVGYWTFDGKDVNWGSNTAYDRSPSGANDGTISGATTAIGKIGAALSFDGADDVVNAGDINALDGTDKFTISQWVKILQFVDNKNIYSKYVNNNNRIGIIFSGTLGRLYVILANDANTFGQVNVGAIATNTWYHFVTVFDGSGTTDDGKLKLYINGVSSINSFSGTIPATTDDNAAALELGNFPGVIDDVRIYNRALSSSEIQQLYNMGR